MLAPEISLIREDDREIYFANRPLAGIFFLLVGLGIVYYFTTRVSDPAPRWIFTGAGSLFAIIGLLAALWRYELRLDLLTRNYSGRKGFWPNPKIIRGSLDDLEGIVLSTRTDQTNNNRSVTVWTLSLRFRNWAKPVSIKESMSEVDACKALEHYAKKLRIPAVDKTGKTERATSWENLDKPLREQHDHPVAIPPRPMPSLIELTQKPGGRTIILPSSGFSLPALATMLAGFLFFAVGSLFLAIVLFGATKVQGAVWVAYVLPPIFMLVGLFIMYSGIAAMSGRTLVKEERDEVVYQVLLGGRSFKTMRIQKKQVEEVAVKPVPGRDLQEVVIRGRRDAIHVSGQNLNSQELEWVRVALSVIVSSGA